MVEKGKNMKKSNEKIWSKIFCPTNLKIYNIIIFFMAIIIFELGYCNHTFTENLIQGEITTFYFSICRGVIYILAFIAVMLFNLKVNFEGIQKSYQNRKKRIVVITYFSIAIIILLGIGLKAILTEGTTILLIQLSMLLLAILGGATSVIYISSNYTVNIISMFLLLSIFAITCKTYNVLDEKKHFMEAYNISYGNLDFNNPIVDKQFMENIPRGTHYITMAENFKTPYNYEKGEIPEDDKADSTPAAYSPVLYMPSAFGILLGRLLGGSVADVFFLGRIFNLLTYMGLAVIILKILPYKKNITFAILMIPLLTCLAGTYSSDALGMGLVTLFVAYCLKLYQDKENITLKKLLILIALYGLTLTFKSMSYIGIGLLIFILPLKDILKKMKHKTIWLILFGLCILGLVLLIQPKIDIDAGDARVENTGFSAQLENIIEHPSILLKVAYNHLTQSLLNYNWLVDINFRHYFSEAATWIFLIMLIYYIYIALKDDSINFGKKEKIIFIITFLVVYGMTSAVLYLTFTPVGSEVLTGYSPRYILPIVLLILMCVSNKNLKNTEMPTDTLIKTNFICEIFLLTSLIGSIFMW